jgi:dTDP-glucose 4,6-dehydratase
VYGDILEGSFSEQDRLKPSNPYAASKASADMLCCAYHRTYGMDVLVTRCANNFGPYQFPEKLIPKTIIRGYKNLPIPVYGTGKNMREWLYVGDHCSAIETVIEKGQAGEIYNISSGHEHTNIELVEKILELMGREKSLVKLVPDRPGHDLRYSLDVKKIKKLGWNPKYSFEKALQSTIKWYINNELWWKPLATQVVLAETPWIK